MLPRPCCRTQPRCTTPPAQLNGIAQDSTRIDGQRDLKFESQRPKTVTQRMPECAKANKNGSDWKGQIRPRLIAHKHTQTQIGGNATQLVSRQRRRRKKRKRNPPPPGPLHFKSKGPLSFKVKDSPSFSLGCRSSESALPYSLNCFKSPNLQPCCMY